MSTAPPKFVRKKRLPKLPSGTTARAVPEWVGKTPDDWPPPPKVRLRVLERQGGKCAITGHKFRPGDAKKLDHRVALSDKGENREGNLQYILDDAHKAKTKIEAAERKKVRDKAKSHHDLKDPPKQQLQSRNDLAKSDKAPKLERTSIEHMPSNLARRYGIK